MFYVYELQNPLKDNEPFYVGKGKDRRAYRHFQAVEWKESTSNPHKTRTLKLIKESGLEPGIKIFPCSSEEEAFHLERDLIQKYGRSIDGGILTNLCLGGEGNSSGHKPVLQYNVFRDLIARHASLQEAAVAVGAFNSSSIVAACKKSPTSGNGVRTPYGYVWCYEGEQPDWDWVFVKKKPVFLYNDRGDLVARAPNLSQLQQTYGFDPGAVSLALKQRRKYRGFIVSDHPLHKDDFPSL
jgi:hypothetical protein